MKMYVLFPLGKIILTPGTLRLFGKNQVNPEELLRRHQSGDWGVIPEADRTENRLSLRKGYRILSAYEVGHEKVWIITEADRSSTCILLPSEY